MALVIPPPTAIPNSLNPTTAAVERDAEKREITPAVTAENASAATSDSTSNNHEINYRGGKHRGEHQVNPDTEDVDDDSVSSGVTELFQDEKDTEEPYEELIISDELTPEIRITLLIAKKQQILAKSNITAHDRSQLAEINYAIRVALLALLRLKELDEIRSFATQKSMPQDIIKQADNLNAKAVSLDDLFAFTHEDELGITGISATTKLARAVIGQFYEDNIEPQLQAQIDRKE